MSLAISSQANIWFEQNYFIENFCGVLETAFWDHSDVLHKNSWGFLETSTTTFVTALPLLEIRTLDNKLPWTTQRDSVTLVCISLVSFALLHWKWTKEMGAFSQVTYINLLQYTSHNQLLEFKKWFANELQRLISFFHFI